MFTKDTKIFQYIPFPASRPTNNSVIIMGSPRACQQRKATMAKGCGCAVPLSLSYFLIIVIKFQNDSHLREPNLVSWPILASASSKTKDQTLDLSKFVKDTLPIVKQSSSLQCHSPDGLFLLISAGIINPEENSTMRWSLSALYIELLLVWQPKWTAFHSGREDNPSKYCLWDCIVYASICAYNALQQPRFIATFYH